VILQISTSWVAGITGVNHHPDLVFSAGCGITIFYMLVLLLFSISILFY
jgi:hypothetical protein